MAKTNFIKGLAVLGGIFSVAGLLLVVGSVLGFVRITFTQPQDSLQSGLIACDEKLIKTYNNLVTTFPSNDNEIAEKASKTRVLSSRIQKVADFDKDPTCAFMVFRIAVANEDTETARAQLGTVKELSKENNFPSNQLLDLVSIDSMEGLLTSLKTTPGSEPLGSG